MDQQVWKGVCSSATDKGVVVVVGVAGGGGGGGWELIREEDKSKQGRWSGTLSVGGRGWAELAKHDLAWVLQKVKSLTFYW